MRRAMVLLVIGALTLKPIAARGEDDDASIANTVGAITIGTAGVVGVTTAIGNGVSAGKGRRPHLAWRICGIVSAAANLGMVGMWAAIAAHGGSSRPNAIGFTIGHLAIGGLDIAMLTWGWTRPPAEHRVSLGPILSDGAGRPVLGASLVVGGW